MVWEVDALILYDDLSGVAGVGDVEDAGVDVPEEAGAAEIALLQFEVPTETVGGVVGLLAGVVFEGVFEVALGAVLAGLGQGVEVRAVVGDQGAGLEQGRVVVARSAAFQKAGPVLQIVGRRRTGCAGASGIDR